MPHTFARSRQTVAQLTGYTDNMRGYTIGGAFLGAFLATIIGAIYLLSQGWYYEAVGAWMPLLGYAPLFLYISAIVIGLLVGACVGALIGNTRHHLWQTWLRLDATLIDWLQKRGKN